MREHPFAGSARLGWDTQLWVMFRGLPEATGSECLGSMTPETQDIYLRMDHLRRRSGYRLGRIIARQQLLKKIAGGKQVTVYGLWLGSQLLPEFFWPRELSKHLVNK